MVRNFCSTDLNIKMDKIYSKLEGHQQVGTVYLWLMLDIIFNITPCVAKGPKEQIKLVGHRGLQGMYLTGENMEWIGGISGENRRSHGLVHTYVIKVEGGRCHDRYQPRHFQGCKMVSNGRVGCGYRGIFCMDITKVKGVTSHDRGLRWTTP